jgi:glyoxylate/hydroxypyruvate reductase A
MRHRPGNAGSQERVMRVVFYCPWANAETWLAELRACARELTFVAWPDLEDPATIDAAVVWRPPAGLLRQLPYLRVVCAMGAGVDYLFGPGLEPPDVPIVRLVDPVMAERMASYVLAAILYHQRQLGRYRAQQAERVWRPSTHQDTSEVRVGVLGLGAMGRASAALLAKVGYDVAGWSRRAKALAGVRCYAGRAQWRRFLARSDVLVCLLPLTPATRGILDRTTFDALPEGALLINAARGDHLIEAALVAALDAGRLAGAVLDVFPVEPLPDDHPLWRHPKVLITPHVASLSNPASGAAQIAAALRAVRAGRKPAHLVDRADYLGPPERREVRPPSGS